MTESATDTAVTHRATDVAVNDPATDDAVNDSALVDELLADRTYYIEFNGHLTNHAKHAVVALHGIGAGPEEIRRYYQGYARLTAYGFGLEPPRPSEVTITEQNWREYLGRRTGFAAYCDYFDAEEHRLGMDGVLSRYLPVLLDGWVASFTHATIHLGWALDAGSRWMAIEGLAYLAFSHVSCHAERAEAPGLTGPGGGSAVDALLELAAAWDADRPGLTAQVERVIAGSDPGIHPELARSGLQYRIARMLDAGHPLMYGSLSWTAGQDAETCFAQLYRAVSLLYLADPGDFVLLHLITSLYAMEQIAAHLPAERRMDVVRHFWIGMTGVVFAERLMPTRAKLAALAELFAEATDPAEAAADWTWLGARARLEAEEHNPKLVYVLRRIWDRDHAALYRAAAGQFTRTPELPPSFEQPPAE